MTVRRRAAVPKRSSRSRRPSTLSKLGTSAFRVRLFKVESFSFDRASGYDVILPYTHAHTSFANNGRPEPGPAEMPAPQKKTTFPLSSSFKR